MTNFKPKDLIAIIVLLSIVGMKIRNIDGGLDVAFALILGYYFGHRKSGIDNGK